MPHNDRLDLTTKGTLEAWVKVTSFTHAGLLFGRNAYGSYALYYLTSGPARFGKFGFDEVVSIVPLSLNAWNHLVAVRSEGTNYIYLNGVRDNSGPGADWAPVAVPIVLGRLTLEDFRFEGIYGEARIYDRALSPLEIQRNYLETKWRYR